MPNCTRCALQLDNGMERKRDWERTAWGDEYCDALYQCEKCGAWSLVTYVDRFAGENETSVRGPLSDEEIAAFTGRTETPDQKPI